MQSQNRYLDDLAKLLTNAAGAAKGVGQEIETIIHQKAERIMATFDFVPRDEFEALKARLVTLEDQLESMTEGGAGKGAAKQTKASAKKKTSSQAKM